MKKTFKNIELMEINNAITKMQESATRFPAKVLWNLKINKKRITEVLTVCAECEKEIKAEYSTDDKSTISEENPEIRTVRPEYLQEFQTKIFELNMQETDIDINTVPFSLVEDIDMTPTEWTAIEFMIVEDNNLV